MNSRYAFREPGVEGGKAVLAVDHDPREFWASLGDGAGMEEAWTGQPHAECRLVSLECVE